MSWTSTVRFALAIVAALVSLVVSLAKLWQGVHAPPLLDDPLDLADRQHPAARALAFIARLRQHRYWRGSAFSLMAY